MPAASRPGEVRQLDSGLLDAGGELDDLIAAEDVDIAGIHVQSEPARRLRLELALQRPVDSPTIRTRLLPRGDIQFALAVGGEPAGSARVLSSAPGLPGRRRKVWPPSIGQAMR